MTPDRPVGVVLLPGLDGTNALRATFAARLSQDRAVTVIPYPDDEALDYRALDGFVRDRLPEGRFVVLGESFSGPVAITLAHDAPDLVAGLILVSTFAKNPWPSALSHAVPLLDARLCPDWLLDLIMLGDRTSPVLAHTLQTVAAALPRAVLQARARAALTIDVSDQLAATRCPVLCLSGRSDWLIQSRSRAHIVRCRPDCRVVTLDGAHNLLMTHVDEATLAVGQFCNRA